MELEKAVRVLAELDGMVADLLAQRVDLERDRDAVVHELAVFVVLEPLVVSAYPRSIGPMWRAHAEELQQRLIDLMCVLEMQPVRLERLNAERSALREHQARLARELAPQERRHLARLRGAHKV